MIQRTPLLFFAMTLVSGAAFGQTLPPQQDSYVVPSSATNYGSAATLNVGGAPAAETLVQFDLSGLPAGTPAAAISSAALQIFVHAVGNAGTVNVSLANGSWTESGVSGNNSPVPGAAVASGIIVPPANSWLSIDVTAAVRNWLSGTANNGFIVSAASPGVIVQFDSKESTTTSHAAQLAVYLTPVLTQSELPGSTSSDLALGVGAASIEPGTTSGSAIESVAVGPDACNLCATPGPGYTRASWDVAVGYGAANSTTNGLGASHNAVAIGYGATTFININDNVNCMPWDQSTGGQIAVGNQSQAGCRNATVVGNGSSALGADSGSFGPHNVGTSIDSWLIGTNIFDQGFAGLAFSNHAFLDAYGEAVFGGDMLPFYGGITDMYIGPPHTNYSNGAAHSVTLHASNGGLGAFSTGTAQNVPGATLNLAAGAGTGNAAGGFVTIQTAPAGASGTTQNPLVTRLSISPSGVVNFPGFGPGAAVFDASGNLSSTSTLSVSRYIETLHTPASSSEPCTAGTFTDDANYHYVCVSTNTWKRVVLSSF